jgi:tRNA(fMet)-specific endonuclease VapC
MRFLLDTSFLVSLLRGAPWARAALAGLKTTDVGVSAVTAGELFEGVYRSAAPAVEERKVQQILAPLAVIPFGLAEAQQWGMLEATLHRAGAPIEAEDAQIAATALVHGLAVVTANVRHFARVKGLEVEDWQTNPPPEG